MTPAIDAACTLADILWSPPESCGPQATSVADTRHNLTSVPPQVAFLQPWIVWGTVQSGEGPLRLHTGMVGTSIQLVNMPRWAPS
mmetsp:Transcript_3535/g.6144  ORF Transcript_3535/g.6144 Transcript_3535/m.6144 type:complete len:85 (-) Transcript_3535:207-461(-)